MKGWENKFKHPEKVMEEIIKFSGGQPFLTQKLCQLMVNESTKLNPDFVEKVVESQIINYIQSGNDYQEHFTTIRDHLLCEKN
jgi:hypothetical protein